MTKIKICGMTCEEDIKAVNKYLPDYIGFVLFFPKSKRNISIKQAKDLLAKADKRIKTVAVVVSPTIEQLLQIEEARFDYIQIHGTMTKEVYEQCTLPILRAFNISNLEKLEEYEIKDKIKGYVFDSKNPGSGETFDWKLLAHIRQKQKTVIFLAGGIDENNVKRAISEVAPDVIDLSSAVEKVSKDGAFCGKDPEKVKTIITIVHGQ
ncbi:MAG: phosphoribosylanthranilate isomerase [Eubacterium sp.]|nr:phosphoribosylanthranilate isomerase [Eubacterium sp.]